MKIKGFIKTNVGFIVPFVPIVGILIFGFIKGLLKNETFISYLEITIETIFLFFVLREFKMTRKSFEWRSEEKQKRNNEEATEQLKYIYSFLVYSFCQKVRGIRLEEPFLLLRKKEIEDAIKENREEFVNQNLHGERPTLQTLQEKLKEVMSELEQLKKEREKYFHISVDDIADYISKDILRDSDIDFTKEERGLIKILVDLKNYYFMSLKIALKRVFFPWSVFFLRGTPPEDELLKIAAVEKRTEEEAIIKKLLEDSHLVLLPDYVSINNLDRKVIEKIYYKICFGYAN